MEITHGRKILTGKQLKGVIFALTIFTKPCVDKQGLSKLLCNYRLRKVCPVGGKCNSEDVV